MTGGEAMRLRARLDAGLEALGLALDAPTRARLIDYIALLARWNRTYNLTAVRDPDEMVARHLLDSLALAPHLPPGDLADLGSGAGLPGIPLALAHPTRRVQLVEANGKKARFLREAKRALALDAVSVVEARAEAGPPDGVRVALVTARALADLALLSRLAAPWLGADGLLLAAKGPNWRDEDQALAPGFAVERAVALDVPGVDATRHLVILRGPAFPDGAFRP